MLAQSEIRLDTNIVDYAILALYFVAVLGIGFAAKRYIKTSLDYFLSGRSLPAWITGLAFISANLGALEILGMAANGAQFGVYTVHYYWIGAVPAMVFLGIVMMPFYYGSKVRSVPEYLRLRFNKQTHLFNALTFAIATVLIAGVNLYALALVLKLMLGWPILLGIVVAAAVVLVYITLGGLSSAIYNEVLQFFVILAALIPLTIVGLHDVGGWDGLKEAVMKVNSKDELFHSWQGTAVGNVDNPLGASWIPIVFGLGFVLSFGYWTTNFAEVQRALQRQEPERRATHAADRRVPEGVDPGHHDHPRPRRAGHDPGPRRQGPQPGVQQRDPAADERVPAQRHARRSRSRACWRRSWRASRPTCRRSTRSSPTTSGSPTSAPAESDDYYLRFGRIATVTGIVIGIGTALIASGYNNIMDYIQLLFSFFNAPLFATFIIGMFWKRMTPWAGLWGLVAGTARRRGGALREQLGHHRPRLRPGGGVLGRDRGLRRRRRRDRGRLDVHAAEAGRGAAGTRPRHGQRSRGSSPRRRRPGIANRPRWRSACSASSSS